MSDLDIPAFLQRKLNPQTPATIEERRAYAAASTPAPRQRETVVVVEDSVALSRGELEEIAEIKAMVGTSLDLAKRMASDFVKRNSDRKIQARRRAALRAIKGLGRH